jgi:nitronate monooxygenase
MTISTRLTKFFQIQHPVVLAPMTPVAGGELAAAVSAAGGLGLLGGGYGQWDSLKAEFAKAQAAKARIGCGFIAWSVAHDPALLDYALEQKPVAMMLSFSDPAPLARRIIDAGVPLICQIHSAEQARHALDIGASVIVAQGTDAGGHSASQRGTFPLVPAIADVVAKNRPDAILLGAGGVADGRGLAAMLNLGADGALVGTRFWATKESLVHSAAKARILGATGDETIRTSVYDIATSRIWPEGYTGRVMINDFVRTWQGRETELAEVAAAQFQAIQEAQETGNFDIANVTVGEAIGLIDSIPAAGDLLRQIVADAEQVLTRSAGLIVS